jgi:hypothetical protein
MLSSAPGCNVVQLNEISPKDRHRPVRELRPIYAGVCLALPQICHKNRGGSRSLERGVHFFQVDTFSYLGKVTVKSRPGIVSQRDLSLLSYLNGRGQKIYDILPGGE